MTLRLAFGDAPGRPRRLTLAGELTIGRDEGSAVRLPARNVSRRHARIVVEGGIAYLEDLGSRNGTLVNGQPVRGRRRLRGGDVVRIADELLRVEDGAATPTAELGPPPAGDRPPPLPRDRRPTVELRPPGRLRGALAAALRALSGKGA